MGQKKWRNEAVTVGSRLANVANVLRNDTPDRREDAPVSPDHATPETAQSRENAQDAFVAALGHRLRGPLHTMFAAVSQLRSPIEAVRDRAAGIIERHLQREAEIVNELEGILQGLKFQSREDTMTGTRLPRLLIVDDSVDALEMWAFYFRSSAYDVDTAASGAAALASAERRTPDVVLLDLQLPDMSGLDVAKRLKDSPATAHVPLIAVTGMGGNKDHDAAKRAGFQQIAVKPCPPADLLAKVEAAMSMEPPKLVANDR